MDRASDYGSEGCRFESCPARQNPLQSNRLQGVSFLVRGSPALCLPYAYRRWMRSVLGSLDHPQHHDLLKKVERRGRPGHDALLARDIWTHPRAANDIPRTVRSHGR